MMSQAIETKNSETNFVWSEEETALHVQAIVKCKTPKHVLIASFARFFGLCIDPCKYLSGQKRLHGAEQTFVRISSNFSSLLTGKVFAQLIGQILVRIDKYRTKESPIRKKIWADKYLSGTV